MKLKNYEDTIEYGTFCDSCRREAPTKNVVFYQNIGALIVRFEKKIKGNLCKSCIKKYFWQFTFLTFILGWWGARSFVLTLYYIPNNIIRYIGSLNLKAGSKDARIIELTDAMINTLVPFQKNAWERVLNGESVKSISEDIAKKAKVRPGHVVLFLRLIAENKLPELQLGWSPPQKSSKF